MLAHILDMHGEITARAHQIADPITAFAQGLRQAPEPHRRVRELICRSANRVTGEPFAGSVQGVDQHVSAIDDPGQHVADLEKTPLNSPPRLFQVGENAAFAAI
ncbi:MULTISPECIES: hypothetical protein [unclassified Caulobacter]|uniref:hypothetical protein n=1 Tax=unclassified Caulobacter TaxID=2648921 RepID=UPI001E5325CC|nr:MULTISPECIES: hypothetical protein [unclassified Caulobacter]